MTISSDVSEKLAASVFRITEYGSAGCCSINRNIVIHLARTQKIIFTAISTAKT
jgi:hypothetical protein